MSRASLFLTLSISLPSTRVALLISLDPSLSSVPRSPIECTLIVCVHGARVHQHITCNPSTTFSTVL